VQVPRCSQTAHAKLARRFGTADAECPGALAHGLRARNDVRAASQTRRDAMPRLWRLGFSRGSGQDSTRLLPTAPERQQRPARFCLQLPSTRARAAREVATNLGASLVRAAHELPRDRLDAERTTMAFLHAHVGPIFVEPDQLGSSRPEPGVILAADPHVAAQQRKAARSARQALGDDRQMWSVLGSRPGPQAVELRCESAGAPAQEALPQQAGQHGAASGGHAGFRAGMRSRSRHAKRVSGSYK